MFVVDVMLEIVMDDDVSDDVVFVDDIDVVMVDGMIFDILVDDVEVQVDVDLVQDEIMVGDDMVEEIFLFFELVELIINQIVLNVVGVKVNVLGLLKVLEGGDFSVLVGQIKVEYEGVNGLLDKLGVMGLIFEDQMMGVCMMLVMFVKFVDGNFEKLVIDFEFCDGGVIFVNGQQIK